MKDVQVQKIGRGTDSFDEISSPNGCVRALDCGTMAQITSDVRFGKLCN